MAKKIIIVDDAPITRLMLRDIFEYSGYEIIAECENGIDAVNKYKELHPDLVTMDVTMPDKDGISALEDILAFDKEAKVVMVTAVDERESLIKAIRLGAIDYIIKPFEEERVISAVKTAFGQ